jgi:hypothetical protein
VVVVGVPVPVELGVVEVNCPLLRPVTTAWESTFLRNELKSELIFALTLLCPWDAAKVSIRAASVSTLDV